MNKRPVILLDHKALYLPAKPDEEPKLNMALLEAITAFGIKDTYLVHHEDFYTGDKIKEDVGDLIKQLKPYSFTVRGVLTPADIEVPTATDSYKQAPGAAYEYLIDPQYSCIASTLEISATRKTSFETKTTAAQAKRTKDQSPQQQIFEYFDANKPDWVGPCIYIDTDPIVISATTLSKPASKPYPLLANEYNTKQYYQASLETYYQQLYDAEYQKIVNLMPNQSKDIQKRLRTLLLAADTIRANPKLSTHIPKDYQEKQTPLLNRMAVLTESLTRTRYLLEDPSADEIEDYRAYAKRTGVASSIGLRILSKILFGIAAVFAAAIILNKPTKNFLLKNIVSKRTSLLVI